MSRSDRLIARIENALRGIKVETSELFYYDVKESPFGPVIIVTFLWRVAEDDRQADDVAREVSARLSEKNSCVLFHKTRRLAGERLLTAAQALNPNDVHYNYNELVSFTHSWLINITQADKNQAEKIRKEKQQENSLLRFRM